MARKSILLLLAPALATPACLEPGKIGKDPLMPLPSLQATDWRDCAKKCGDSLACKQFSFKADTEPLPNGCWLFPNGETKMEDDPKAFSGPTGCEFHTSALVDIESAADAAGESAADATNTVVGGLRGAAAGTAQQGLDTVVDGVNAAAEGKELVGGEAGADHTLLYCILGGSAAAAAWKRCFGGCI